MDLTTWPQVNMINQKNYYTWVGLAIEECAVVLLYPGISCSKLFLDNPRALFIFTLMKCAYIESTSSGMTRSFHFVSSKMSGAIK